MVPTDASAKARALYDARRARVPIVPFTDAEPDLTVAEAYAVQRALLERLLADGDRLLGYKVGLTSRAMQELLGVDSPDFGPVLASTRYADGGTIPLDRFIAPRIEAEIAFVLGQRLQGPGVTTETARAALSGAMAALEVVDSRIVDWRIRLADTVADLASNGALVTSGRVVPVADVDWSAVALVFRRGEQVLATSTGAAALGDPVAVVAWLANVLGEQGVALEAGHVVLTGALHAAVPLAEGDVFTADFDRLGALTVDVAAHSAGPAAG